MRRTSPMPLLAYLTPEPRPDRWREKPHAQPAFAHAVLTMGDGELAARLRVPEGPGPSAAHLMP